MTSKWDIQEDLNGKTHEDVLLDHEARLRDLEAQGRSQNHGDLNLYDWETECLNLRRELNIVKAKLDSAVQAMEVCVSNEPTGLYADHSAFYWTLRATLRKLKDTDR